MIRPFPEMHGFDFFISAGAGRGNPAPSPLCVRPSRAGVPAASLTHENQTLLQIDHITVAAESLRAGVAHAEAALGVTIPFGGAHPLMGTHNHLLRLGDTLFLEIIAPDPAAGALLRRRWFGLDDKKQRAALAVSPRLVTWVVATTDIETSLRQVPHAAGPAITVTRGELAWLISVPPDGAMPFDGAFPTLI